MISNPWIEQFGMTHMSRPGALLSLVLRRGGFVGALLLARATALVAAPPSPSLPASRSTSTADSSRANGDTLQWYFVSQDKTPIAGVTVRTTPGDGTWTTRVSDSTGHVTVVLSPKGWATVEAAGFRPARVDYLDPDGAPPPKSAVFHLRSAIAGIVNDEQGRPVVNATVDVDTTLARDDTLGSRRSPIARAVTDKDGHFVVAPRAFYVGNGYINSDDPLTVFVSAANPRRVGVVPLTFEAQSVAKPMLPITVAPPRSVRLRVAAGSGEHVELEVLPPDSAAIKYRSEWMPRQLMRVALRPVDAHQWGATVPLPVNAQYRTHLILDNGTDIQSETFVVTPGTDTLALKAFGLSTDAERFLAGIAGTPAPELQATTVDGTPVHLSDYRGKVVVLDFWGYWCQPCVAKFPTLVRIATKYRDSNVVVLSIHDASVASAAEYRTHYATTVARQVGATPLPFPELLDTPRMDTVSGQAARPVHEPGTGQTIAAYGVRSFPTTLVLDPQGRLVGNAPNVMEMNVDASGHVIPGSMQPADHDQVLEALIHQARSQSEPVAGH